MFELKERDAAGRISKWTVNKREVTLPEIAIVINPGKMLISPSELQKEFRHDLIITNAYIIQKSELKSKIQKQGLHKFFKFSGTIMTDSGAYQAMYGRELPITNKDIIKFQEKIKPDIGTFLDVPSRDLQLREAKKTVLETTKRAKECKSLTKNSKLLWSAPIQGGEHLALVKRSAQQLAKLNFDIYPVGSIVPKMMRYDFKTVCEQIITAKMFLPSNKPVHAFGLGLPSFMSLAVAIGADVFDSAAYALYAYDDRYMTLEGTHSLEELSELPCSCPVCSKHTAKEIKTADRLERQNLLARHNLYVTLSEIKTIRQAIRENNLWELVQQRARAHPRLLEALSFVLKKYKKYFLENDPVSKKSAFFYLGEESKHRPEIIRAVEKLKKIKTKRFFKKEPFGKIPSGLKNFYPFSQSIIPEHRDSKIRIKSSEIFSKSIEYQFKKTRIKPNLDVSRKTGRIRRAFHKNKLLGTFRPSDGFFLPSIYGAGLIKMKKVFVDKYAAEYIKKGKSLFAKFITKTDKDIFPGEEVSIYHKRKLLAVGKALLNSKEMKEFQRGTPVKIRKSLRS